MKRIPSCIHENMSVAPPKHPSAKDVGLSFRKLLPDGTCVQRAADTVTVDADITEFCIVGLSIGVGCGNKLLHLLVGPGATASRTFREHTFSSHFTRAGDS